MAWIAVATGGSALLNVGVGLFSGKKNRKRSQEAADREAGFRERELDQADAQFDWSKQVYGEHKEKYDPIFDEMRESMDDVQPDYQMIAGDINQSFDSARGMERRQQRRYGIKPTSGAAQQSEKLYGIKRGAAHVGARSAARMGVKDKKYARRADLYNSGQGIGSDNASRVTASMAGQQNASRSAANAAGRDSEMYDQRSMQDSAGWGQALGSVPWADIFNGVKGWGSSPSGGSGGNSGRGA